MMTKRDRKSTRLNSSHTVIYTLSHTTLFRSPDRSRQRHEVPRGWVIHFPRRRQEVAMQAGNDDDEARSEEHTSELQSHSDLHSFPHDALPISRSFPPAS